MENRITGRSPERIPDEEVDLTENPSAIELCEEVKRLTAETREALLEQALAVSNEKCNALISRLNARDSRMRINLNQPPNRRFRPFRQILARCMVYTFGRLCQKSSKTAARRSQANLTAKNDKDKAVERSRTRMYYERE